jgi:dynein heavy chain
MSVFSFVQTRSFLSPEEVLKGLQGEIEEVLNNISLSVNVLKELFRAYDFCCKNMKLFFKVPPDSRARIRAGTPPTCRQVGLQQACTLPCPFSLLKDKEIVPWEFPSSLAFSRMNSFFHRVQTIEVNTLLCSSSPHSPDCLL